MPNDPNIIDESNLGNLSPISVPPVVSGQRVSNPAPVPNNIAYETFNTGALPNQFGLDTDVASNDFPPGSPFSRIIPAYGGPQANAKTVSIVTEAINEAIGSGTISLTMPSIFAVSGSPAELGSGFTVALVPENPDTVFAGPPGPSGVAALDGSSVGSGNTTAITTGTVTVTNPDDFCVCGVVDPNPNTRTLTPGIGWTGDFNQFITYSGSPSESFHFLSESQTPGATGPLQGTATDSVAENWAAVLVCFLPPTAAVPVALQKAGSAVSNVNTATTATATLTNPTQANSTLIVVWTITGTGTSTCTDSQGNSYILAANSINLDDTAAQVGVYYAPVTTPGATTVTITSVSGGATAIALYVYEVSNLLSNVAPAIPTFRKLVAADLPTDIPTSSLSGSIPVTMLGGGGGPTWTFGFGAPSGTQPTGSIYSNMTGGVGTTIYYYNGSSWSTVS